MPCRTDYMDPTPGESKAAAELRKKVEALGDKLTYSSDVLREYLLGNEKLESTLPHINFDATSAYIELRKENDKLYGMVRLDEKLLAQVNQMVSDYEDLNILATRMEKPSKRELVWIEKAQIKHREADLRRLMKTFAATGERELLKKVLDADNKLPLEPQLGFSPDAY